MIGLGLITILFLGAVFYLICSVLESFGGGGALPNFPLFKIIQIFEEERENL